MQSIAFLPKSVRLNGAPRRQRKRSAHTHVSSKMKNEIGMLKSRIEVTFRFLSVSKREKERRRESMQRMKRYEAHQTYGQKSSSNQDKSLPPAKFRNIVLICKLSKSNPKKRGK